jgi:hypothetical protein
MTVFAKNKPVRPPVIKKETMPMAKRNAGVKWRFPLYSVVIQLNTFIEDGTAIIKDVRLKTEPRKGSIPETNMW